MRPSGGHLHLYVEVAQPDHRLAGDRLHPDALGMARRIGLQGNVLRGHAVIAGEDEQGRLEQALCFQHVEDAAETTVGLRDRRAQPVAVRAVAVTGAVGQRELVGDEHRRRVRRVVEQDHQLGHAARIEDRLAVDRFVSLGLVAGADLRRVLRGQGLEAVSRADDAAFQGGVIGAAPLRLVNVGRESRRAEDPVERFVQGLDSAVRGTSPSSSPRPAAPERAASRARSRSG